MKIKSAPELRTAINLRKGGERFRPLPNAGKEREPSTMPAHDLDDEGTRVREGSRLNVVDSFANTVQRSGGTDGHVGHRHVVIDRTDETYDLEVTVSLGLFLGDFAYARKLTQRIIWSAKTTCLVHGAARRGLAIPP